MIAIVILTILGIAAVAGIAASSVVISRDGYRSVRTREFEIR